MQRTGFEYEIRARIDFETSELELLCKLASRHYDGVCQAAAREQGWRWGPGAGRRVWEEAGFLRVALNQKKTFEAEGPSSFYMTFRQIDTIAKITETAPPLLTDDELAMMVVLHLSARKILVEINKEHARITPA